MKAWLILFLIAFNLPPNGLKAQQTTNQTTLIEIGQQAPDFVFVDELQQSKNLYELKGKVVLLNFFATWCGPCMKELPHIQKEIFDKYGNNNDFILLAIGREHSQQEMNEFKREKAFSFSIIADPEREIYSKFATQFIPRNILIDKEGKIRYSSIGFEEKEFAQLIRTIEAQLN